MVSVEDLDCQACAACCRGDEGWVHIDATEDARIDASPALAQLVVLTRVGAYLKRSLRMIDGACAGLAADGARWTCTVYPDRPSVCREVEKGSPTCRAARKARGFDETQT